MIHRCFSADSVEEIMSRLEKEDSDKARECLKSMSNASPLSLCVTHKLLKTVENLPLHECLMYDYRLATNFLVFLFFVFQIIIEKFWRVKIRIL